MTKRIDITFDNKSAYFYLMLAFISSACVAEIIVEKGEGKI